MNWVGGVRKRKPEIHEPILIAGSVVERVSNFKFLGVLDSAEASNNVVQLDMKKDTKVPIRRHNIELPMSPCSTPSRIFLEESQHSMQKEEWSSRKHFTNTTNFRYGESHFIGDGRSSSTEVTEHDLLADDENLLTDHRRLPKHSNTRLLQNPLLENSSRHSSNCGKYVSFSMQDAFPPSQNITTEIATTGQNLTSYGRDFPPTQCYNLERIQPVANFLCQENMPHPYALTDSDFNINVAYNRSNMYGTSDGNDKVVAEDAESEYIFTEPKPNSFKESIEKDFGRHNSLDKQFLESSSEEFRIQKDITLRPEQAWRCLDYRRKVLSNSPESSQSPSYSPKETESCCSVFSDMSELDVQNVRFDASVLSKGSVQEKLLDDKVVRENFKGQCAPRHENLRESNSTHRVSGEQKENEHQFVPSLMYCSSEAPIFEQNVVHTSSHGQDAWTQTESSLTYMGWSNVAIQCNLSDVADSLFLCDKEVTNVEDDQNCLEQTTRSHYSSVKQKNHCLDH
ncbi:uncharacterized protein LOC132403829 isoform X2 [Hypanus sabinus]|uniref:uncharacterized protein LOC132403829 isoform X2 n=1 Tax=Hypanus sabinus TaxID=79690 RepID=UPI0028C4E6EB|nr:uncharacterized protein LOC132403829 isoform X2 [Hypanus sabinus]